MKTLGSGTIKRLHVDRRIMAQNKRDGTNKAALTIQTSKGPIKANNVIVKGVVHFIQSKKPLSCGARAWVETYDEVLYR